MKLSKTEKAVWELAKGVEDRLGFTLYDVEYVKEGPHYFLRVYIISEREKMLEMCENVSRYLSDELDRLDIIAENYFLEVSSPGIERKLRHEQHFEEAIGENVKAVKKGSGEVFGILEKNTADELIIDGEAVKKSDILRVNIMFDFNEKENL